MFQPPPIRNILVPTDFSDDAELAFAHALRLALALEAQLDILHVEPGNVESDWHWAPRVLDTLKRWGHREAEVSATGVAAYGIRVRRTMASGVAADAAILEEIAASHADLVVLATHGRAGLERWLQPSVSEAVLRRRPVPVLLIPAGSKGFVDLASGEASLHRVLVPIDETPNPAPAFDGAIAFLRGLAGGEAQLATLHVGTGNPHVDLLEAPPGWDVFHWNASGPVVDGILGVASTWHPDLIVAVTEGRRGFLDALRGSTVERLVAAAATPVLVVPADWGARDSS